MTPAELQGHLGMTFVSPKVEPVQALFLEALITFVLVLTVCGVCDDLRKDVKGSAPLAIGLSISVCHLMAVRHLLKILKTVLHRIYLKRFDDR